MCAATAPSSPRCTTWSAGSNDAAAALITPAEAATPVLALARTNGAAILTTDLVERLDAANPYFLVILAEAGGAETGGAGLVAAVDVVTGEVISSARLERVERHRLPGKAEAIARAAYADDAAARRVWAPSRATRSPFYPLWELTAGSGRVYVDMSGTVWPAPLESGRG
jgi:hypothetical protein